MPRSSTTAPRWMLDLPGRVSQWLETVQHKPSEQGEPWGLSAFCVDSSIPYSIVSTSIAWLDADLCGGIEKMPGYHPRAREEMAAWAQSFQDPKTRQFIDPLHESCVPEIANPRVRYEFREAVSKYAVNLLTRCGAGPIYPYVSGGDDEGRFDPERYLAYIKSGDWDNTPWGIGSHAAGQTAQLLRLVNAGHDEYIPALIEGAEFILSKQNPRTGMWGRDDAGLDQQIGGALKVIGRFQFLMGLISPHMDKLADSILANHRSGAFYVSGNSACVPRNVAEMAYACMEASDYRRDELRQVLIEIVDELARYQRDDGGFSSARSGAGRVHWCQSIVADAAARPRSDVMGPQLVMHSLIEVYHWLDWTGGPWPRPVYWRTALKEALYKYAIVSDAAGRVRVDAPESH